MVQFRVSLSLVSNNKMDSVKRSGLLTQKFLSPQTEVFREHLIDEFNLLGKKKDSSVEAEVALTLWEKYRNWWRKLSSRFPKLNPTLNVWAVWFLASKAFTTAIFLMILINSITIGVQTELSDNKSPEAKLTVDVLEFIDKFALWMFVGEILLKWMVNFKDFWNDGWNILDFTVTVLSLLADFISIIISYETDEAIQSYITLIRTLRVFRITRSLKIIMRIQSCKMIIVSVTKAFHAMFFIITLLLMFLYIFAIAGVILFEQHSKSVRDDIKYRNAFKSLPKTVTSLFQLFTLDRWLEMSNDMIKVVDSRFVGVYFFLWIVACSFIFRNLFAGTMVSNFQNIRKELMDEVQNIKEKEIKLDNKLYELEVEVCVLNKLDTIQKQEQQSSTDLSWDSSKVSVERIHPCDFSAEMYGGIEWEERLLEEAKLLRQRVSETVWPEDTLFQYYCLMEQMYETHAEREYLLRLAA